MNQPARDYDDIHWLTVALGLFIDDDCECPSNQHPGDQSCRVCFARWVTEHNGLDQDAWHEDQCGCSAGFRDCVSLAALEET